MPLSWQSQQVDGRYRGRRAWDVGRVDASKGPRPFDRGDRSPARRRPGGPLASKGPRPFDRGDEFRNGHPSPGAPASKGPRPFDRGDQHAVRWGKKASILLQRGRDLSIAETRLQNPPSRWEYGCFKGAATFRSRRRPMRVRLCKCAYWLQRGRDLSIAETPRGRRMGGTIPTASKGPRPFDRGDMREWDGGSFAEGLQRGRDLSIAETRAADVGSVIHALLQRGRDLSIAETHRPRLEACVVPPASKGPRPFDRGDRVPRRRRPLPQPGASKGPRPFDRGDDRRSRTG